ncbi:ABC transporter ATP-binding protein [Arthrobacter nitrophenolicus]|uniref:ABC-type branched-subunit amino acid transport system ATPase component n=1 Tax=Arthrobacter nitrophenolicus TaxID=683150 RepID=A0ACC6TKF7_9MICC
MTTSNSGSLGGQTVLEARDVAVHYGGIKAVDGLNISLPAGKIAGIVGPNGSGKSTLLAALTRLVPLTRGELILGGRPYHHKAPHVVARHGVSRTFQTVRLLADRTIRENIALATDVRRVDKPPTRKQLEEQIDVAIERTGLGSLQKRRPDEVSYGVQRKVEIARAIANNPTVLLLDEPTAGMNRQERNQISELMVKLRQDGLTQLLIEHDVQMMVDTCDYLYAMNFGVLIAEGEPESVIKDAAVQEAYLGTRGSKKHA